MTFDPRHQDSTSNLIALSEANRHVRHAPRPAQEQADGFTANRERFAISVHGDGLDIRCRRCGRVWHFSQGWTFLAANLVMDTHLEGHPNG